MRFSGADDKAVLGGYRLYEKYASHTQLNSAEKQELLPARELLVSVYKFIKLNGGWRHDAETLCRRTGLEDTKVAPVRTALDVLSELGLIIGGSDGYIMPETETKTDLQKSEILKFLNGGGTNG